MLILGKAQLSISRSKMSDGRLGVGESTSNVVFEDAQIIRFILSLEGVGNDCKILHINDTTKSKENEEATCY